MNEMLEIANKIEQAGGTLYLVGGAIRNELLGIPVTDEDYCVTGLTKEQFQNIFPEAKIQGKDFPVFILNKREIAIARKERKAGIGHKEFEFTTNADITIEEDLARRDLTINSIAKEVLTGKIIDPFNGQKDIEDRILRKTTEAFSEDPLRVYRVARFAATLSINLQNNSVNLQSNKKEIEKLDSQYKLSKENNFIAGNFTVETETLKFMNSLKNELLTLSKERVFSEFCKALSSSKPSIFIEILKQANVLDVHFKEISQLIGKIQPEKYHPEGDSYIHTMIVVDNSAKLTDDLAVRFSCLVHDLGKGVTPKEILPHHYGHDEKGIKLVQDLGHRIGVPNSWMKCGKTACKWHMKAGIFEKMTPKKQVELIENVGKSMLGLEGLKIVVACDKNRENLINTFNNIKFASLGEQCLKEVNRRQGSRKISKLNRKSFRRQATPRKSKMDKEQKVE